MFSPTHPPTHPIALCADNVPGVSGIGPKTALALLREHGSLATLLEAAAAGRVKPKKAAASLVSGGWVVGDLYCCVALLLAVFESKGSCSIPLSIEPPSPL